jgi:hypothetical protein
LKRAHNVLIDVRCGKRTGTSVLFGKKWQEFDNFAQCHTIPVFFNLIKYDIFNQLLNEIAELVANFTEKLQCKKKQ